MSRRTTLWVTGSSHARRRGALARFGCGIWLSCSIPILPAYASDEPATQQADPNFARALRGPAWTAAMQSAGVLSNGPAFVASPFERNPPPPARLFFNDRPIGDPRAPERFRQDTSSLETPISPDAPAETSPAAPSPEPVAPPEVAAPPIEAPPRSAQAPRRPAPTRQATRESEPEKPRHPAHAVERRAKTAERPAARVGIAKKAPEPARVRQAAREEEPADEPARPDRRPLLTGRSAAVKPSASVSPKLRRPPPERAASAAPVIRIAREPRVPVIALPSSLLPTQP